MTTRESITRAKALEFGLKTGVPREVALWVASNCQASLLRAILEDAAQQHRMLAAAGAPPTLLAAYVANDCGIEAVRVDLATHAQPDGSLPAAAAREIEQRLMSRRSGAYVFEQQRADRRAAALHARGITP